MHPLSSGRNRQPLLRGVVLGTAERTFCDSSAISTRRKALVIGHDPSHCKLRRRLQCRRRPRLTSLSRNGFLTLAWQKALGVLRLRKRHRQLSSPAHGILESQQWLLHTILKCLQEKHPPVLQSLRLTKVIKVRMKTIPISFPAMKSEPSCGQGKNLASMIAMKWMQGHFTGAVGQRSLFIQGTSVLATLGYVLHRVEI